MELAVEYTRNAPDKRPADAPVYHVKGGREPRLFVSAFHGWDRYFFLSYFLSFFPCQSHNEISAAPYFLFFLFFLEYALCAV